VRKTRLDIVFETLALTTKDTISLATEIKYSDRLLFSLFKDIWPPPSEECRSSCIGDGRSCERHVLHGHPGRADSSQLPSLHPYMAWMSGCQYGIQHSGNKSACGSVIRCMAREFGKTNTNALDQIIEAARHNCHALLDVGDRPCLARRNGLITHVCA
jgi:hypothetical protein